MEDASAWCSLRIAGRTLKNSCRQRSRNGWAAVKTRRSSSWSSSHEFCYGPLEHKVLCLGGRKKAGIKIIKEPLGASEVAQPVKEFASRFHSLSSIPRTHHMVPKSCCLTSTCMPWQMYVPYVIYQENILK